MIALSIDRLTALVEIGGPVVAILLGLSVLSLATAVWKVLMFWFEGVGAKSNRGPVGATLENVRNARRQNAPLSDLRERSYARLETHFSKAASGLRFLDVVAQIAPLLGLFGTVLGMIAAFRTLQEAGGTADPAVLAGGIWVALVTTAAGLVVAMPASMALSWFDAKLEAHRIESIDALEEILSPNMFEASQTIGALSHA